MPRGSVDQINSDNAGLPLLKKRVMEFPVPARQTSCVFIKLRRYAGTRGADSPPENGRSFPTPAWQPAAARGFIASTQRARST